MLVCQRFRCQFLPGLWLTSPHGMGRGPCWERWLNVAKVLMNAGRRPVLNPTRAKNRPWKPSCLVSWPPSLLQGTFLLVRPMISLCSLCKDKSGRTVIHERSCTRVGCDCPSRLAAGSVDSLVGKLRAVFNDHGRPHDANPVAHPRVKAYVKFVRAEQAARSVTPVQAVPLFFAKFSSLVHFLKCTIQNSTLLTLVDKYILVRDATFFVTDFFTGDRATDLGRLAANQVFRLKDRNGYLLKFTLAKNLRGDIPRPFVLEPFGRHVRSVLSLGSTTTYLCASCWVWSQPRDFSFAPPTGR